MSLYGMYIKERRGMEIIEDDLSFATFSQINETDMYIEDIFVRPEYRRGKIAFDLGERLKGIAKERGLKKLIGSVNCLTTSPTVSMAALIKFGFKIKSANNNMIVLEMEI